jgi:hypothetical protein
MQYIVCCGDGVFVDTAFIVKFRICKKHVRLWLASGEVRKGHDPDICAWALAQEDLFITGPFGDAERLMRRRGRTG